MTQVTKHVRTTIRYDGPMLSAHEMDVHDLAPALLALADLIQIANQKFNGSHANIRVLVNADVEQKCFMIDICLVQTFLEQAKGLLGDDGVKTAKEIAEWIGIISGGSVSLLAAIKFLSGARKGGRALEIESSGDGNIIISGGDNKITVSKQVYILLQEPRAIEKVKGIIKPLQNEGYEQVSFVNGDSEVAGFNSEDAANIEVMPSEPLSDIPSESVSHIRGQVRIKSAQYEGGAQWSFLWNGRAINAEMTEQAADWVALFQDNQVSAPPNSILEVSMAETAKLDAQGLIMGKASYVVMEVHKVTPPPRQTGLFDLN